MRLLRLAGAAFGPFRQEFAIDFAAFEADGVYLIAGPTGAGKSTILDAVTFALYGSAPRYAGRQQHLRSDLAGPEQATWVELELAVGERVLRVRRSPEYERPKQRGTGTTKERASAQLLELIDGEWRAVSTNVGDVGVEVGRTLGLTKDEFLQVILLAQSGFAKFLAASSDERKLLLQRLFGTGSMRRLRELLLEDARSVETERSDLERVRDERGGRVRAVLDDLRQGAPAGDDAPAADAPADAAVIDEALLESAAAALDSRVAAAEGTAERAARGEREARLERDAARALAERFARRAAAEGSLGRLDEVADAIDAERAILADADRAAEAASALDRWDRADRAAERTATAATAATDALLRAGLLEEAALPDAASAGAQSAPTPERDAVEQAHASAADDVALAGTAVRLEAELPALEREATATAAAAAAADAAVDGARRERTEAPSHREAIAQARERAATIAAGLGAAERAVDAGRERLEARVEADRLLRPLERARESAATTAAAQAAAAGEAQRLQAARLAGIAGEIASSLADGEACPVCGAIEHPAPHAPGADAVTADDVGEALDAAEQAAAASRAANDTLGELERRLAAVEARAGDDDRSALEAALAEAESECAACTEAERERARQVALLAAHDEEARGRDERIAELEQHAARARSAEAAAAARLVDARQRLVEARGEHASASALLAERTARARTLRDWLDADAEHRRTLAERSEAAAAGAAALAEHGLPARETTAAMRLAPGDRTTLRQRIRAHDDAVASARGVLAQPDLADLEGEAPALAPLDAALEATEAAARDAGKAAAAASTSRDHTLADIAAARQAIRALADGAAEATTVRALSRALQGDNELRQDIETYVLATRLGAIIDAANLRLTTMTGGRFSLLHDESTAYRRKASGLGIEVLDAHTGVPRTAASLSSGETFLASLALALGLADVVQAESGGVSLETLFVDEGFGSLDQDTLEAALATLDELRAGGRSVGVISHVQQMQERIPARIRVVLEPGGGSRIDVSPAGAPATG
ncbi:AAA family ATPase [Agrococcus sp. Marseille-P2731]|uniref:AAA family ATPase n=1 Tax=Agrococcus sp. Marseille-P2731 TaxID=1841862 RepID=UPI000931567D|nr:SMC family ATPase [Agrococcus sp. Marseille-P2731]